MTHTELDIDYRDEKLRIKFYILVKPADVCVYVCDRLKEKREKVRQEGQTENGHEMCVGGGCVTVGEARDSNFSSRPDYLI